MKVTSVTVNGVTLRVDVTGPEASTPVLVLHGFTGSAAAMGGLVGTLARRSVVMAPDLVGHGRSDAPADVGSYTTEAQVAQLDAVLAATAVDRIDVVGYSMGARLALSWACARPHRLRRLVLIGGTAGIEDGDERERRIAADEALARLIEHEGVAAFVDEWEALPLFAGQQALHPDVQAAIRRGRLANRPEGLANSLRGFGAGSMPPLWNRLSTIDVPTLAIAGGSDTKYVTLARRLADALPDGNAVTIDGAGHAAHLEAPDAVAVAVTAHLAP